MMSSWAKSKDPPEGYHINAFRINNGTAAKAFVLGEKVSRSDGWEAEVSTLLLLIIMSLRGTDWKVCFIKDVIN